MFKQLLVSASAICMITMASFYYAPSPVAGKEVSKGPIQLTYTGTLSPGGAPVMVVFDFETTTNSITGTKVYYYTNPTNPCLQCSPSVEVTGGPINFAGGAWRAVNSITVTCSEGSITIPTGTALGTVGPLC